MEIILVTQQRLTIKVNDKIYTYFLFSKNFYHDDDDFPFTNESISNGDFVYCLKHLINNSCI